MTLRFSREAAAPPPDSPPLRADDPGMHPAQPWRLEFGARPEGSRTRFRVWAPDVKQLALRIAGGATLPLESGADGVFEAVAEAPPGKDYFYLPEGGEALPDPVSRWQPQGVHGPSRVVDPQAFPWTDAAWRGIPLEAMVLYELHTGSFTPQGTFRAAEERLPYLRELGVTAVSLMPVAEFPGRRNWGYDGVHLYAPHSAYGGPDGLKRLVDGCHREGLAVVLDVVYNHLGPEGNILGRYGPYFSARYRTPWGDALNFDAADCDPVRRYFIDNALYWLTEYHVDGLRLDAVHGIYDFGARHILEELGEVFHRQADLLGRQAWLIAESDLNDVRVINPRGQGGWNLDAQWSDDFHHALHALLTGSRRGYFVDFGRISHLAKALENGYVYDGQYSVYRRRRHGNSSAARPGRQFVVFAQNHDQVANGSQGDRLGTLVSPEQQKLAAALVVCAPCLPMLFMGQEYGETAPFFYFTSHGDAALAEAVRRGRREEMAPFLGGRPFADPQDENTFARSRLDWSLPEREPHAGLLRFHRELLRLRRGHACLGNCRMDLARVVHDEQGAWLALLREDPGGEAACLLCNFAPESRAVPLPAGRSPWRLALWSGEERFGEASAHPAPPAQVETGGGAAPTVELGPWQAALYLRGATTGKGGAP